MSSALSASSAMLTNLIQRKQRLQTPMTVYPDETRQIKTDMDHFPFLQFYRGRYLDTTPHVFSRDAGYVQYKRLEYRMPYRNLPRTEPVFQMPCTTILPRRVPAVYDPRQSNLTALAYY